MTISKPEMQYPWTVMDNLRTQILFRRFKQLSRTNLRTGDIPTDKVIRRAVLNDLGQPQIIPSTGDWDLVAKPRAEFPANVDDDGLFHQTDTDEQMDEIPRNNPIGEIILNNLQHVQSSLSAVARNLITPLLRANHEDELFHLTGIDLQTGEILKTKIEAIMNDFRSIGESILNQLQRAQSTISTGDRDLDTPPKDDLREINDDDRLVTQPQDDLRTDDDDGLLHLSGTELQTGEILKDKSIGDAILNNLEQVQSILPPEDRDLVTEFAAELRANDEVALVIGTFPLLYRLPSGKLSLSKTGSRLGMNLLVDLFAFLTLRDGEWLTSTVIDGVLAELALISPGVQLMSAQKAYEYICKLRQNITVESSDVIQLHPNTHTLIFPFNLSESHWVVAKATFGTATRHEDGCLLTVYNSAPEVDTRLIKTELPKIMKCILDANSTNFHWRNWWAAAKRRQGRSLKQQDSHNCGIYAIFNILALVQLQEPSLRLESFDPRALRIKYALALSRVI